MTKWARVSVADNVIQEMIEFDPDGIFAEDEDFTWIVVPTDAEGWVLVGWTLQENGDYLPPSIDALVTGINSRVSSKRWSRQNVGIVVNGAKFLSDPTNLGIISNAILGGQVIESQYGPGSFPPINWKSETGFVTLTLMELIGVGMFGMQYTQGCFNREGTIMIGVHSIANGAGTIEEKTAALIAEYNAQIDTNWPDNSTTTTPPVEEPPAP